MTTEKGLNVKTVQNGSIVIKHYLIKVEEAIAIWHALIISGTPCCKKPDYRKRNLEIHRFFLRTSLIAQFVKLHIHVPQALFEYLPLNDSSCEDSGIE